MMPKMQWSLTDEGMGILERAGLAGLYLSLTAAEEWAARGDPQAQELQRALTWELSDQSVKLWWEGDDLTVLKKLVEWAWQSKEGVFLLPGVHRTADDREHLWKRLDIHTGLLQTFFQHTKVVGRESPVTDIIPLDEDKFLRTDNYQKLKGEVPQPKLLKEIVRDNIRGEIITLSKSWIYPGAAKRFGKEAKAEEHWSGMPKVAFILLFAPIACVYFELPKNKVRKKKLLQNNWMFLVPEIRSLHDFNEKFPRIREQSPLDFLRVKVRGLGDAALRFASAYAGRDLERRLHIQKIYLVAMGQVNYYFEQKVRKRLLELTPSQTSIKRYTRMMKYLPNEFRPRKMKVAEAAAANASSGQEIVWIRQPTSRGRIADNIIHGRPWYQDLLWPPPWQLDELEDQRQRQRQKLEEIISLERLWFNNLLNERRSLMGLTKEETMWHSPEEQALLKIFHDSLRRLLEKEWEAAKSRGGSRTFQERWGDRVDTVRRALMRAKTRELNRKFLMEFLAEGGGSRELTEKKEALWRFLNDPYDWQKARDLALLALVTFTDKRLGKPKEIP